MSKNSDDKIVKYTIMPRNEQDEYFENFKLSLTEFAKALDGKVLIAPFIVYNSDLDIPMDMDEQIEEYCMYASKEELLDVIRKKETMDVFRTLILHGFDISLDETRDIYCALSRRNEADICINTIQDIELDSNLTFYLYNDLDKLDEDEWDEIKSGLREDMQEYINEYKFYEEEFKIFEDMEQQDLLELLPFFMGDMDEGSIDEFMETFNEKKKNLKDKEKEEEPKALTPINIPLPKDLDKLDDIQEEEPLEQMIKCAYDSPEGYIAINKIAEDLYTIEDDDYEVLLTADQIDFIVQQYNRIKDKNLK